MIGRYPFQRPTVAGRPGPEFIPIGEEHPFANLLREFSMEGLAILLPGFGFLAASIPAIWLPMFFFAVALDYRATFWRLDFSTLAYLRAIGQLFGISFGEPHFLDAFTKAITLLSAFHIEFFIAVTGISYMIGHLMFRRDPKDPDFLSFIKINLVGVKNWRKTTR